MANKNKQADRHQGAAVFARLPEDLYEKLRNLAKMERRTIGAQLILVIEAYFYAPALNQNVNQNTPMGNRPEDFKP